jgi:hypothetical protein
MDHTAQFNGDDVDDVEMVQPRHSATESEINIESENYINNIRGLSKIDDSVPDALPEQQSTQSNQSN